MEEEYEEATTSTLQNESPYHTKEAEIKDWTSPFPIKNREFCAWVTCAETEGILYIREEELQKVYKDLEKNIKEFFDTNTTELDRSEHNWQPGQLCTIALNDFWYRGNFLQCYIWYKHRTPTNAEVFDSFFSYI